ncbi:MAG: hypothetical protein ACFE85_02055 [Candidatus Hodarchaeota archaeon]
MKKWDKIIIIATIISIPIIGISSFLFISQKHFGDSYQISEEGIIASSLIINNQIKVGDLQFQLLSSSSENILEAEWTVDYKGIYDKNKFVIIDYKQEGSDLIINIYSDIHIGTGNYKQINILLDVYINPAYINYSFISDSEFANLEFNTYGINFENFEILSQSGNVDVKLNRSSIVNDFKVITTSGDIDLMLDFINFTNNFISTSDSGDLNFDFWNIKFCSSANFNATSLMGLVIVRWANHFNKSHNVNIFLKSNNYAFLKMWSPIEIIRYDLLLDATTGTTDFDTSAGLFVQLDTNHYQSFNINTTGVDMCNITAITTSGLANVFIVNCFKWKRLCAWGEDFEPYDVNTFGDYVIHNESSVNSIELYNLKYTYLNTTTNITLNFETLPVSSENLVYVDWDLTYQHAMGIGVGSIDLAVSNVTQADVLKVYLELDFELDRILPTFSDYNVTVFYHPSYPFYNYTI